MLIKSLSAYEGSLTGAAKALLWFFWFLTRGIFVVAYVYAKML